MISVEQIKAARGLLEWTQEDLSKAAGLSKPSINMLERRIANPKQETLESIQKAFEKAGVAFTEGPGVKLKSTILKTQIFEGNDSLFRLLNDIFEELKGSDEPVLISGVDETNYQKLGGERIVKEIKKRGKYGIPTYLLIREGDTNFANAETHFYRWFPKDFFSSTPHYVYKNKYAILLWGPPQKVIIIENMEIAASYRQQFWAHWEASKEIPTNNT